MRRGILLSIVSLGVAAVLTGCGTSPVSNGSTGEALWLPAAHEVFVSIDNDSSYTIVPGTDTDVLLLEKMTGRDRRETWIVRMPRDAALERVHRVSAVDEKGLPRAWVMEEIMGEPSTLVPAEGTVVLHGRTLESTRATVVLEATVGRAPAGQILPDVLRLTRRDSWARLERDPTMWAPRYSRSGAQPVGRSDSTDPFSQFEEKDLSER